MKEKFEKYYASAYGLKNWTPRLPTHREEIGTIWAKSGLNSEWAQLKSVLLHKPGLELSNLIDADTFQMYHIPDLELSQHQHDNLTKKLRDFGVTVHYVNPCSTSYPNLMFCADLIFMTPEGAILARPASTTRAGEERWIARRLADLGIPILRSLNGNATFEGADAQWINSKTVLIGSGFRTNKEAADQITDILNRMNVDVICTDLPIGTMHLMGILRFIDHDIALAWPYRLAWRAFTALKEYGYKVLLAPDDTEATHNGALNFVTLRPKEILMAEGSTVTQSFLEEQGVICHTVRVDELLKAAGGIGCLTAVLEREII